MGFIGLFFTYFAKRTPPTINFLYFLPQGIARSLTIEVRSPSRSCHAEGREESIRIKKFPYGTKLKNKFSKKIMRCTSSYSRGVLPIESVNAPIEIVRCINITLRLQIPRLNSQLKTIAIATISGIAKPILVRAEPSAKFIYFVGDSLLLSTPLRPSGKSTNIAKTMPIIVFGASTTLMPTSIEGLSNFAKPVIAIKDRINRAILTAHI